MALANPGVHLAGLVLAWLVGTAVQLQQAQLWPLHYCAALMLAGGVALVSARLRRSPLAWLAVAALAGGLTGWRADALVSQRLAPDLEGQDLILVGTVASLPRRSADGERFIFAVEQAWRGAAPVRVPARLMLGWWAGDGDETLAPGATAVRAGERWRLGVRLRHAHGLLNPHGFDTELWLFEQGIVASGSVRAAPWPQRLHAFAAHPVERLRQRVRDAIDARLGRTREAGVVAGLAIGDQGAIAERDWAVFRDSGTAHLMAISGLHVAMFAWGSAALARVLWRRSARLTLAWPAPTAARWLGVLAAAAYALLAGWGVPAQRTVWMLVCVAALSSLGARWPWPWVLLAAAGVVALADPWALLQAGFWLSFSAVALLLVAHRRDTQPPPTRTGVALAALRSGWRTQWVATLGLAPLTLLLFQQVSVIGFLANLIAIPWVTFVVTPLALTGMAWGPLWDVAAGAVDVMVRALGWATELPWVVWHVAASASWVQALALLGGVLVFAPLPRTLRAFGVLLIAPLLWPVVGAPEHGRFDVVAADVGQGNAVLVRTQHHLLVYDSGPQAVAGGDAGARVLVPLLRARGERKIDLLVLSHRDSDHVGGARSLMAAVPVREWLSSLSDDHALRVASTIEHRRCDAGQSWQWDGVRFEVLHPLAQDHARQGRANALSCVLRVVAGNGHALLLSGDIEAAQEAALVMRAADGLRSTVLLVPHHGSRGASTLPFIAAVAPQLALVQAGYRNRYGHPAPEVGARYASQSVVMLRSDRCGAWVGRDDGTGVCERERRRRYWYHASVP